MNIRSKELTPPPDKYKIEGGSLLIITKSKELALVDQSKIEGVSSHRWIYDWRS